MKRETFYCLCGHLEHQLIANVIDDDLDTTVVYLSMNLSNEFSFFKRLKLGIKYIFGYRSKFGMFSEVLLDEIETIKFIRFLNQALLDKKMDVPN